MLNKQEIIRHQMEMIYLTSCFPRITLNTKTQEMNMEYVWRDNEAKNTFDALGKVLELENPQPTC